MDEVPKHATKDDCWTVVDGLVYNVTPFIPYHPGGKKIMQGAGKESSEMFCK
jgi:L-lactate dehydrogenase (cytochrome)